MISIVCLKVYWDYHELVQIVYLVNASNVIVISSLRSVKHCKCWCCEILIKKKKNKILQQEQMARPYSTKTISKTNSSVQKMLQILLFHKSQQEVLSHGKRRQLNPAKMPHTA